MLNCLIEGVRSLFLTRDSQRGTIQALFHNERLSERASSLDTQDIANDASDLLEPYRLDTFALESDPLSWIIALLQSDS